MNISKTLISTGLAVLVGAASPAFAQHHRGGGSEGGGGSNSGSENRGSAVQRGTPREAGPRADSGQQRNNGQRADSVQRGSVAPDYSRAVPRDNFRGSPNYGNSQRGYSVAPRGYSNERGGGSYRERGGNVYRGYSDRGYGSVRGYGSYGYGSGYGYGYGSGYGDRRGGFSVRIAPRRFYRPYYTFRPRLSLGFGLWAGYPFAYYDPYYYPDYSYSYPYPDAGYPAYPPPVSYPQSAYPQSAYPQSAYPQSGYPQSAYPSAAYPQSAPGSIGVQPGQANSGGVSFDITPGDAELIVDGNDVGTVDQFTPTSQPLGLTAGRHRVEIRAPGYQTVSLDVNIVAGQVIPYQGNLER
jgi:hypothetical protein